MHPLSSNGLVDFAPDVDAGQTPDRGEQHRPTGKQARAPERGDECTNAGAEEAKEIDDEFTGREAVALTDLSPGTTGKVEFKGTTWKAETSSSIIKGQVVIIKNKENFTLFVEPK